MIKYTVRRPVEELTPEHVECLCLSKTMEPNNEVINVWLSKGLSALLSTHLLPFAVTCWRRRHRDPAGAADTEHGVQHPNPRPVRGGYERGSGGDRSHLYVLLT